MLFTRSDDNIVRPITSFPISSIHKRLHNRGSHI